jgi:hypothetical protein
MHTAHSAQHTTDDTHTEREDVHLPHDDRGGRAALVLELAHLVVGLPPRIATTEGEV